MLCHRMHVLEHCCSSRWYLWQEGCMLQVIDPMADRKESWSKREDGAKRRHREWDANKERPTWPTTVQSKQRCFRCSCQLVISAIYAIFSNFCSMDMPTVICSPDIFHHCEWAGTYDCRSSFLNIPKIRIGCFPADITKARLNDWCSPLQRTHWLWGLHLKILLAIGGIQQ